MTLALSCYSGVFMRYALAVTPKNYLLFGCHVVNFSAQLTQGYRFVDYWYMGGRDKRLKAKADDGLANAEGAVKDAASELKDSAKSVADEAKKQVDKVAGR
jgi:mitochondrial pyruvate carrier 1